MAATASTVANWLFVEQPGPWGVDALVASRLPRRVVRHLREQSHRHGVRVILLRRPGRDIGSEAAPACFAAHAGPDRPWTARIPIGDPHELLDLDLGPLGSGLPPGGAERTDEPLLLVCTNGRRDPCCAERGRPLARALAEELGSLVWECSHIGGDRFAGNLVCFPHGVYFGRLDADQGPRTARAYLEGRIDLAHYRGRACHPFPVQAAEVHIRRATGLAGVDDLRLHSWEATAPDAFAVRFQGPQGRRFRVAVRIERDPIERPLTCHADRTVGPPRYIVVDPVEPGGVMDTA